MFNAKEMKAIMDIDNRVISKMFNKHNKDWRARAFVTKEATGITFTMPKSLSFMGFTVRYFHNLFAFEVKTVATQAPSHLWPTNIERAMHEIGAIFAKSIKKPWPEDRNAVAFTMQRRGPKLFMRFSEPFLDHDPYVEPVEMDPSDADDLL